MPQLRGEGWVVRASFCFILCGGELWGARFALDVTIAGAPNWHCQRHGLTDAHWITFRPTTCGFLFSARTQSPVRACMQSKSIATLLDASGHPE